MGLENGKEVPLTIESCKQQYVALAGLRIA
jgi:hypothetical protein